MEKNEKVAFCQFNLSQHKGFVVDVKNNKK